MVLNGAQQDTNGAKMSPFKGEDEAELHVLVHKYCSYSDQHELQSLLNSNSWRLDSNRNPWMAWRNKTKQHNKSLTSAGYLKL